MFVAAVANCAENTIIKLCFEDRNLGNKFVAVRRPIFGWELKRKILDLF